MAQNRALTGRLTNLPDPRVSVMGHDHSRQSSSSPKPLRRPRSCVIAQSFQRQPNLGKVTATLRTHEGRGIMVDFFSDALPYISQAATLAIAAAAVAFSHRASKEVGQRELSTKMWEKRTDTYTEILRALQDLDPTRRPTPEGFIAQSDQAPPEGMELLARDLESEEWKEFTARVDSFASDEVRYLLYLWLASLSGWCWLIMKCVIHHGSDAAKYSEANDELQRSYKAIHAVRLELTEQIRAELSFKQRFVRKVEVTGPEKYFGAVIDVQFTRGKQVDLEPLHAAHLTSIARQSTETRVQMVDRTPRTDARFRPASDA